MSVPRLVSLYHCLLCFALSLPHNASPSHCLLLKALPIDQVKFNEKYDKLHASMVYSTTGGQMQTHPSVVHDKVLSEHIYLI